MNLKLINSAIASYEKSLGEADVKRLAFFKGLWEEMDKWSTGPVTAGKRYEVPNAEDVAKAFSADKPVLSVYPASLSKERFRAVYEGLLRYVAEADAFDVADIEASQGVDLGALLDGAAIDLAEKDPEGFLSGMLGRLQKLDLSDQAVRIVVMLMMMTLRVELETVAAQVAPLLPKGEAADHHPHHCPVCGSLPALSKVGGAGSPTEGRGRVLWCQQCGTTWEYERVRCVRCGTQNQAHLHFFNVEGDDGHRIAMCDECGGYIRTVFLEDALMPFSFEVEEVVTARLDAIAHDPRFSNEK